VSYDFRYYRFRYPNRGGGAGGDNDFVSGVTDGPIPLMTSPLYLNAELTDLPVPVVLKAVFAGRSLFHFWHSPSKMTEAPETRKGFRCRRQIHLKGPHRSLDRSLSAFVSNSSIGRPRQGAGNSAWVTPGEAPPPVVVEPLLPRTGMNLLTSTDRVPFKMWTSSRFVPYGIRYFQYVDLHSLDPEQNRNLSAQPFEPRLRHRL
jgi:hypothetical protein